MKRQSGWHQVMSTCAWNMRAYSSKGRNSCKPRSSPKKRFVSIRESPYHGLNFCQGTVAEMLKDPGKQIYDVIRYFGSRGKIFNVHFRNIKGGYLNFQETFPDDGDVDMLKALRIYREVGYDGMIMPDHVPHIDGDVGGTRAFAFAFGYIQALIQRVNQE